MYNRIMAPLDGSKLAEASLKHIKAIASGSQTPEIILLTVIEPLNAEFFDSLYKAPLDRVTQMVRKEAAGLQQKANDYLTVIANDLRKDGLIVKTEVIELTADQGVAETIIDYVKDHKVDLIIVSTHGRSGVSRWAFGSVSEKIIRHANVPVLAVIAEGTRK